jgi:hypothetical protein
MNTTVRYLSPLNLAATLRNRTVPGDDPFEPEEWIARSVAIEVRSHSLRHAQLT